MYYMGRTQAPTRRGFRLKALIVADVHSNLEAFTAAIDDAQRVGGFDEIWSLGDLVGYGPDPAAVIDTIRLHPHHAVAGNHDLASIGRLSLEAFNLNAAEANRWTATQLDQDRKQFLGRQPLKEEIEEFTIVHGSPRDPVWEYVVSVRAAFASFNHFDTYWCLVGHSHIPFVCRLDAERGVVFVNPRFGHPLELGEERLIVNPGSVGQPRDGDPRAAYAVYDAQAETLTHFRVEYDVVATQRKMREHGLPEFLAERLAHGQ